MLLGGWIGASSRLVRLNLGFFQMRSRCLLLVFAGLLGLVLPAGAAPRLSEFMAENKNTLADEDGQFSDWIEIYNPDPVPVNMAGYALTDHAFFPQKWIFPNIVIPSGGHLVVFASGKNRTDPGGPLHTNFSLEQDGEYLALVAPDFSKVTEFSPGYPPQEEDKSYGSAQPTATATAVSPGAEARFVVPFAEIPDWNTLNFDDSLWLQGQTGIGYERSPLDAINYASLIGAGANVEASMYNISGTIYIRVPFTVLSASAVTTLTLRIKYDDGMVVYLNGQRVAAENDPDPLEFNSQATINRSDALGAQYQTFDITAFRSSLVDGTNVLAIHGLNWPLNSSDFIIMPELDVTAAVPGGLFSTGYFPTPTPGSINGALVDGFVKDTNFSVDRGFFTTAFPVTLTTNTPNAVIRYTTDSSAPSATNGTVYTGPVNITKTTVLRVIATKPGWQSSNVDTMTYIFPAGVRAQAASQPGFPTTWGHEYDFQFGTGLTGPLVPADYHMDPAITNAAAYSGQVLTALQSTLPVMSLVGSTDEIFGPDGIYSDGRLDGTDIAASVEFFGPGAGLGFRVRCALRIHGGDALIEHPKKPFRLYFKQEFGPTKLEYPMFPDSPVTKFDKLQLRPGGHDGWAVPFGNTANDLAFHATYVRDQFLRDTERAQGRLSPHGRFLHLYINGLYWGVYNLHEVPSDDYFKSYVGGEEDDWDVVEQTGFLGFKVVDGDGDAMDALLELCDPPTRPADPLVYEEIQRYLDIDQFIDHMIVMIWAGQSDWMAPVFRGTSNVSRFQNKNWDAGRLSRGPTESSFFFSAWDCEISMGTQLAAPWVLVGQKFTDLNFTRVGELGHFFVSQPGDPNPPEEIIPGPPAQIYNALKSNAAFRHRFADRLNKHFFNNGALTTTRARDRLLALRNTLNVPMIVESARWGDVNATALHGTPDFNRDTHWNDEMNWLRDTFIGTRTNTVLAQFKALTPPLYPNATAITFTPFGGVVAVNSKVTVAQVAAGPTIYYTLDGSDPMRTAGVVQSKLVTATSNCKYWIPTSGVLGDTWKELAEPANIGIWSDGKAGLGYDLASTYQPHIETDVSQMLQTAASVYVRIPFTIQNQAQIDSITALTLRMKSDDGYVVYLNGGAPIATLNAPASPAFNSGATAPVELEGEITARIFQNIDVTAQKNQLVVGTNYLCLQGLNLSPLSTDFLLVPELVITTGTTTEGVSPTAILGTTAVGFQVTLTQTSVLKARTRSAAGVWSALTESTYVVGVAAGPTNLVLSEFNYQPADPSTAEASAGYEGSDFEYVELYNPTASAVQLTGCRFTDGIEFNFANSTIQSLAPGGKLLIVKNPTAFISRHGAGLPIAGIFENGTSLSNAGEKIRMEGVTGNEIFDFEYEDNDPWPNPPGGSGLSLVLKAPETFPNHKAPASWRLSRAPGGSPSGDDRRTFSSWLAEQGGTGTELSDPEKDGVVNLLEYAFLGDPTEETGNILPVVGAKTYSPLGVPGEYLTVEYRRDPGAEDLQFSVEFGTNLASWQANGVFVGYDFHADGSVTEKWRSSTPLTGVTREFARVRVLKP